MEQLISYNTLFKDFVDQIETAVNAVANYPPYTKEQIVSISFTVVLKEGIYYDSVKAWRHTTAATKIWDNFNFILLLSSMRSACPPALQHRKATCSIAPPGNRQIHLYSTNYRSYIPPP